MAVTLIAAAGNAAAITGRAAAVAAPVSLPPGAVTMDGYGGLHGTESATLDATGSPYWSGFRIARGLAVYGDGTGGYVLDGYGGIENFGAAPPRGLDGGGYWRGWDIARSIVLNPCDSYRHSGYVLDGFGGVHPFGGAPRVATHAYWPGWDIAKAFAVNPCSGGVISGYVLDGYGGLHSFSSGAAIADVSSAKAYWPGVNIARGIAVVGNAKGYVLDGYGGVHAFGGAPPFVGGPRWPGWDIARAIALLPDGSGGYVMDGYGGLHNLGSAAPLSAAGYWPGWDIAQAVAVVPTHAPVAGPQTTWRGVGAPPLSDAGAAALITPQPETRGDNIAANTYVPSDAQLAAFHAARDSYGQTEAQFQPNRQFVTGRPGLVNPSTDDLIQWAAHKWGIPEDWIRAEMVAESYWHQNALGDRVTVIAAWYTQFPAQSRVPGTLDVYRSMGAMQVGWFPDGSLGAGTEPLRWQSTAFNLDDYGAVIRWYFDGNCGWCTAGYGPGQEWSSIGAWYDPYPWNNSGALNYIASVQSTLAARTWAQPGF